MIPATNSANITCALSAGRAAYYAGEIRAYPVLAPADASPGSISSLDWAADARAWYRGYDIARLSNDLANPQH